MPKQYSMKAETGFYYKDPEPEPGEMEWAELPKDRLVYLENCKREYLEVERSLNKILGTSDKTASARVSVLVGQVKELAQREAILQKVVDRQTARLAQLLEHRSEEEETVTIGQARLEELQGAKDRLEESHRKGDL